MATGGDERTAPAILKTGYLHKQGESSQLKLGSDSALKILRRTRSVITITDLD